MHRLHRQPPGEGLFAGQFQHDFENGPRAERGRFNQGAINFGLGRVEGLAEQQTGEHWIDEDGPIAVVPVEGEQAGLAGLLLCHGLGEFAVCSTIAAADDFDPPFENIADG